MHSARCARTMSKTVLPLMIESSNVIGLLESRRPRGIEDRIEIRCPAVRAEEQRRGGTSDLRRISLDRGERGAAGAAREQSMSHEELTARRHGFALGDQDDVIDGGLRQEWRDDARPDAGDMALLGRVSENDGPLRIDGDDPHFGIALLEPARYAGDRPARADADEDVVERVESGADVAGREMVVRVYGVRIGVLVRPVRVPSRGTELRHHPEAGLQESAGVVALLDFHHPVTQAPQQYLIRTSDDELDHGDEAQADQS